MPHILSRSQAISAKLAALAFVFYLCLSAGLAIARPLSPEAIPEPLKSWQGWVLHGQEEQIQCTPDHNAAMVTNCAWPSVLRLDFQPTSGTFQQEWTVQADDSWLQLPGEKRFWPEGVTVNDRLALVVERQGLPFILASRGEQQIKGHFQWQALPESFQLPASSALIEAVVDNTPMGILSIDNSGRLWLRPPSTEALGQKAEDTITLQVFRRVDDLIPPQVTIHLEIQAAGKRREVNLGGLFPMERFVPLAIEGTLPARLENNGDLLMQVKPGQWQLDLTVRHKVPLPELAFTFPANSDWPETEIWSFQDQPSLRVVKIEGEPTAIDPSQTTVPPAWRNLAAYQVKSGQKLLFREIKRGEPNPPPDQLQLKRDLWLNFDGQGYTVRDTISGKKHNNWRLGVLGNRLGLGRVIMQGQDQLITSLKEGGDAGVEIRQGNIDMTAVSIIAQPTAQIPATGFDTTFQSAGITLHLPPGFSLFDLRGAENVPGTWIGAWTLLDLFLLCISTIACFKVFGPPAAITCFLTLVLLYHQPGAPIWVWLNVIAAVALLKVIPEGKLKTGVQSYRNLCLAAVVIISIPFMIEQIRKGLYPQLEFPYQRMPVLAVKAQAPQAPVPAAMEEVADMAAAPEPENVYDGVRQKSARLYSREMSSSGAALSMPKKLDLVDPDAKIQTGPGLPSWHWRQVNISFNGPVTKEQMLSIRLLGPTINLILAFCRCLAILLFVKVIAGAALPWKPTAKLIAGLALLLPLLTARPGQANEPPPPPLSVAPAKHLSGVDHGSIPSPELLQELQQRLLEPAACFPNCVAVDSLNLREEGERLVITINVSALAKCAMPLPGNLAQWQPERIRFLSEKERNPILLRKGENLWLAMESGQSTIEIVPRLTRQMRALQVNLPIVPQHLHANLSHWQMAGHDNASGSIPSSITLERIAAADQASEQAELTPGALPPFFAVERTISFGLTWQVETVIRRPLPADSAIVLTIPLLKGESVLTDGITVKDGNAELVFTQGLETIHFSSSLEVVPEIRLQHPQTDLYSETWRIAPSSIWHIEFNGPPVITHQADDRWLPTWRPWPGESVSLAVSRPLAVEGPVKTIDASSLMIEAGRNAANVKLDFTLRASQGGQHSIKVPQAAEAIQKFEINGRAYPIQKDVAGRLVFPLVPGQQDVKIEWTQLSPIAVRYATPDIDLGLPSTNSQLSMTIGRDRWPLVLWGPSMGPAVLWWSFIVVTLLASSGLARLKSVPVSFHQWFLLGIGMLQTGVFLPGIFALWLIALAKRKTLSPEVNPSNFNGIQFGLGLLTFAALGALVASISNGLLGYPDMQIRGNGSSNFIFLWYQDIAANLLPQGHLISVPIWSYRLLMLAWALWVSFFLIRLLKWAWQCFSTDKLWVSIPLRPKK